MVDIEWKPRRKVWHGNGWIYFKEYGKK